MAPEHAVLLILWSSLTLYILLGGADFGAGTWEVNLAFQASEKERKLIHHAIGPVWEANHVWLIFVLVCLHTAFPSAFAALSQALWLPLLLALVGIVFRGAGFALRSYAVGSDQQQAFWGALFALASTTTPFFLGAAAGAVASGRLVVKPHGEFAANYFVAWASPLAIFNGFFTVGICAYLAAVYLTREAKQANDAELTRLWRSRALVSGMWVGSLSFVGPVFLASEPDGIWGGFRARAWPLVALAAIAGIGSIWSLWRERYGAAVLGAGATVTSVIWGWGVAQYPDLIPSLISVESAKAPDPVLWAMLVVVAAGMTLLVPSLWWLFIIFKRSAV